MQDSTEHLTLGGEEVHGVTISKKPNLGRHTREQYRKMPSPRGAPEQATGELFSAIQQLDMDGLGRVNDQLETNIKPLQLTEKEWNGELATMLAIGEKKIYSLLPSSGKTAERAGYPTNGSDNSRVWGTCTTKQFNTSWVSYSAFLTLSFPAHFKLVARPGMLPTDWARTQEVPMTTSSGLINLLEWFAELRETFQLTARSKRCKGKGMGKGH